MTLGAKYLVQAELAVPKSEIASKDAWLAAAARFNAIAETLAPHGLAVGYHNHTDEWARIGDQTAGELLFANTHASVSQQIDTAHCLAGGGDPAAIIRRFPGRTRTVHLKERGMRDFGPGEPPFGKGTCPWSDVFAACEGVGGTEWYIMERYIGQTLPNTADLDGARQYIDFMHGRGRA